MTKRHWSEMVAWTILTIFAANSYLLIEKNLWFLLPAALALASAHLLPGRRLLTFDRLVISGHGVDLLIVFLISTAITAAVQTTYVLYLLPEDLLAAVKPEIVCISVARKNSFGHPAPELLERLENFGCTVYRTDLQGDIIIRR